MLILYKSNLYSLEINMNYITLKGKVIQTLLKK